MKKICVITTSLNRGGAERSTAILTQLLFQLKYDVHILMTKNDLNYEFSGTLFNLEEIHGKNVSDFKKIKILRDYFNKHHFDVIIDNRNRVAFFKEFILYNFIFKAKKKIAVVRSFHLKYYLTKNKMLAKLIYRNNIVIVAVSKTIKKAIKANYGLKNVEQIYNSVSIIEDNEDGDGDLIIESDFILWYGRVEEKVKNLTLLLEAFKASILPSNTIKLYIIGEGEGKDVDYLNKKIEELGLKNHVYCMPFLENPFSYVIRAKFTVLTSYYEGFPRVLIESLACSTPVVSVDCNSGPSEIITHGSNGLLVKNHNVEALANAFNSFINDTSLYNTCKSNAVESILKFAPKHIAAEWKILIEE